MRFGLFVVLALLGPTAFASWSPSPVTSEPSSNFDLPDVMWQDPNLSPEDRVYFDVRQVAASISNPLPHVEATLGVWQDCNQDGIMGAAMGATYSAALLFSGECPAGTRHNDGVTVREVLAIGPGLAYPDYADPDARVWADVGVYGAAASPTKTSVDSVLAWSAVEGHWVGTGPLVATEITAYARVGSSTAATFGLTFPSATMKVYGEPCGFNIGPGAPVITGWDCDPTHWPITPRVGDLYQLRDTDCLMPC